MNRITAAIARTKLALVEIDDSAKARLNGQLDLSFDEHVIFQDKKSLAQVQGFITLDEANTIYKHLGESVSVFNRQPLEVKVALTKTFGELMAKVA